MGTAYATRGEVYALGLRAEVFASRPRAIEAVDPTTGTLTLTNAGLFAGEQIFRFRVEGAAIPGAISALLPAGLSPSIMYGALPVMGSSDLFQVAPVGGSVLATFGDTGAGVFSVLVDIGASIDRIALNESANVDNALTGHAPPIKPDPLTGLYHEVLVGVVARRTARRARLVLGLASPTYAESFKPFEDGQAEDSARLKEWLDGRGLLPAPPDQDTIANDAPRATGRRPVLRERRRCV